MDLVWTCRCCGKEYDTLSFAYALDEPDGWGAIPQHQRSHRGVLGSDSCVIDAKHFFIRGRIVIPVIGHDDPFGGIEIDNGVLHLPAGIGSGVSPVKAKAAA